MMFKNVAILILVCICFGFRAQCKTRQCLEEFPADFLFGVASSAHQIEGAWNEEGKVPNAWDHFARTNPEIIVDRSNADVSSDSYHKTEEDVLLLKKLDVDFYRFSISWSRILSYYNKVNMEGISHYSRLIDLLLENGITPMVTIFHFDLPQYIQDIGGFKNHDIIEHFVHYASVVFKNFGDRVKLWTTINELKVFCEFSYGDIYSMPWINQSAVADYRCGHNLLKAHARVYHLYNDVFRPTQKGKIALNLDTPWGEPASTSTKDLAASERYMQFQLGWFAHPIFSKNGDYPSIMKELIAKHSKVQGYPTSRLPTFTQTEIDYIKGTHDLFFLNHYMVEKVAHQEVMSFDVTSLKNDYECNLSYDNSWVNTTTSLFKIAPWALTKTLAWIKKEYGDQEIYITENGFSDMGEISDTGRVSYLKDYLNAILDAICKHGVNVKGYTVWSFMDSYEWFNGYTSKFGLYHVNFTDPSRPRTPKSSATYYKNVINTRKP